MTSDRSANHRAALPGLDARRWAGTFWTCCSSAKWARRLLICATVPWVMYLSNIIRPFVVEHVTARCCGMVTRETGSTQPIPGRASRPIRPRNLCLLLCCSFLCNRRTLPTRAVASCVECSKQHAPTHELPFRGGNGWDWQAGRTTPPPTHQIPVPVRSPARS